MTDCGAVESRSVEIGCGVPRGFHRLEPSPDPVRAAELRAVLTGPAAEVLAAQQRTVGLLGDQGVLFCALGLHRDPGAAGEVRPSVLTLAARVLGGVAPRPLLAELLARARAAGAAGSRLLELPAGPAALLLGRGSGPPPRFEVDPPLLDPPLLDPPLLDGAAPEPPGRLWTGTVALASAAHDRLLLLQLTSACPERAADHRVILVATAHTLTLSGPPRSRIQDALG